MTMKRPLLFSAVALFLTAALISCGNKESGQPTYSNTYIVEGRAPYLIASDFGAVAAMQDVYPPAAGILDTKLYALGVSSIDEIDPGAIEGIGDAGSLFAVVVSENLLGRTLDLTKHPDDSYVLMVIAADDVSGMVLTRSRMSIFVSSDALFTDLSEPGAQPVELEILRGTLRVTYAGGSFTVSANIVLEGERKYECSYSGKPQVIDISDILELIPGEGGTPGWLSY